MSDFESLEALLEDWFDKSFRELPKELRERVESGFYPHSWENLSSSRRREAAGNWDRSHSPANNPMLKNDFEFLVLIDQLEDKIKEWEIVESPTARDKKIKEDRLAQLLKEHAELVAQLQQELGSCRDKRDRELQNAADALAKCWERENKKVTLDKISIELHKSDRWRSEFNTHERIRRLIHKSW